MNAAAETQTRPAWQIVALRELSVKARDKNFLMSLVVTLLLVAGTFGVQIWLSGKTPTSSIAVVTQKNAAGLSGSSLVDAAEKAAKADHDKVEYTSVSASSPADARDAVARVAAQPGAGALGRGSRAGLRHRLCASPLIQGGCECLCDRRCGMRAR